MAVQDKFVDSLVSAGKKTAASHAMGGQQLTVFFNFEVAAADSDTSVYRLARLPANAIPVRSEIYADASLGTSAFCLGLYKPGVGGAVVDKDIFLAATDLTAGVAVTAGANNGLTNLGGSDPVASVGLTLWELLGLSAPNREDYDLTLTADTAGAAAGTISGYLTYVLG